LNKLRSEGLQNWSHTDNTNSYTLYFDSRPQYKSAKAKIMKIPGLSFYYSKPDHLKEVSDAIENLEYFKAFTLCSSLYESFGKSILIAKFKTMSLNSDRLEKLGIQSVIIILYTHGLIKQGTYSDMISINDTRNYFVHRYMSSTQSDKIAGKIKQNIPKIMRSLRKLKEINEKLS